MLKKNLSKSALVVALLTTTVIWRGTTAYAEDPNQAFTLDPMIVTAQRTETRDLDTPATTNIITEQNIKEAGYKNVNDLRCTRWIHVYCLFDENSTVAFLLCFAAWRLCILVRGDDVF